MSSPKKEADLLTGETNLLPSASKINFACPSKSVISEFNLLGLASNDMNEPGVVTTLTDLKAKKDISY